MHKYYMDSWLQEIIANIYTESQFMPDDANHHLVNIDQS